jgi:Xaa-Pro aminopeptidase
MSARLERLHEALASSELDALIVQGEANLRYLTGYTGSNGLALVRAGGGDRFFTDFRYASQVEQQLDRAFEAEIASGGDLIEALAAHLESGRVGFDDTTTTVRRRDRLGELVGAGVELVAAAGLVEGLRAVKEEGEIELIAAAAALTDSIYEWLFARGLGGRTERQLAVELEHEMRLRGASGPSFSSIVASGTAGALPHASPRDVAIERGTLVTIDIGTLLDGYCSDCTRTVAVGEPSPLAREIHELVLAAQLAGLAAVAAGRTGREVDADARRVIEDAGYGDRFGHGLGHGVGLEIHEAPRMARVGGDAVLRAGNVVTVEPGVYLPGELGVRIEDLVVVADDETRVLSRFTKELLVVD